MEMVLFQEDWDKYPHYVVDMKCPNPHFLRFCSTLKTMGIKNHHWPLQLHDRDLIGVNPRAKDLPRDIRDKIIAECHGNFFYAIREVMVAPGSTFETPLWYEANRANMFLYWTILNGVSPYITLIRQGGKSYAMDAWKAWCYELRLAGSSGSIVTTSDALRSANMERLRKICNEIPDWMRGRTLKDAANSEIYRVPTRENFIRAWVSSNSEEGARRICRGQTDTTLNWDEIAYLYNMKLSLGTAASAGARARWDAKLRGDPYGSMYGTTAGQRDTPAGKFAYEMMLNAAQWSESYLDATNQAQFQELVRNQSGRKELLVYGSFLHTQIGRDDKWLQETMKECMVYGEEAEKDFGNKWLSGSLVSPFSGTIADRIEASKVKEPHVTLSEGNFAMRHFTGSTMFITHHRNNWGAIGLDASEAINRDDIGLIVTDSKTGGTTAAGDYNGVSLYNFSEFLAEYMLNNPKTVLVPESKSTARAIMDHVAELLMAEGINPFTRIFNVAYQDPDRYKLIFEDTKHFYNVRNNYGNLKKFLGFGTTGTGQYSRDKLFGSTLTSWANNCCDTAHDAKFISQVLGLEVKNGRLDHGAGKHDDMVVAKLLTHWFFVNGRNLHLYGISPEDVFSQVQTNEDKTEGERYSSFINDKLRERIVKMIDIMEKEEDSMMYKRLETQISSLYSMLKAKDDAVKLSLTEFLNEVEKRNANYSR